MKYTRMNGEGKKRVITIDLRQEDGGSSSSRSITVVSTEGNISVPEHKAIEIGMNVCRPLAKDDR